jgi:hypothetical protein
LRDAYARDGNPREADPIEKRIREAKLIPAEFKNGEPEKTEEKK